MNARPYARADAARAGERGRARRSVDPPAAARARAAARTAGRWSSSSPATRGCAAASTRTSSRAPAPSSPRARSRARSAWSAARGATSSAAAASTSLFEQVGIFQKLRYDDAQAIAQAAVEAFIAGEVDRVVLVYNEFKSVMTQRSSSISCCRSRAPTSTAIAPAVPRRGARRRLPVRAVAAGDLQPAAAALRRGAGVPRAARIERRVLRGADDGDGHGDEELGRDDRAA